MLWLGMVVAVTGRGHNDVGMPNDRLSCCWGGGDKEKFCGGGLCEVFGLSRKAWELG